MVRRPSKPAGLIYGPWNVVPLLNASILVASGSPPRNPAVQLSGCWLGVGGIDRNGSHTLGQNLLKKGMFGSVHSIHIASTLICKINI